VFFALKLEGNIMISISESEHNKEKKKASTAAFTRRK
jgi:hypothetical protein